MSETQNIMTMDLLADQLRALGVQAGQTVMLHSSLRKVKDWLCGGAETVVLAFDAVLGPQGTLVMPAHSNGNSEPSAWENPPVPEAWWPMIRESMPPYQPETAETRQMGVLAEYFRRYPGVRRSGHPHVSVTARGKHANYITADHLLTDGLGETSPYAKLLELDAYVLLLGVKHNNNTTLHLAEHRAQWPSKKHHKAGAAMLIDGQRRWVEFEELDAHAYDFGTLGEAYEMQIGYMPGRIGQAEARFLQLRPLIDFAVGWLSENRR